MAGLVPDTDINHHFMVIKESLVGIDISAADTARVVTEGITKYTEVAVIEDIVLDIVAIEGMAVDTGAAVIEAVIVVKK